MSYDDDLNDFTIYDTAAVDKIVTFNEFCSEFVEISKKVSSIDEVLSDIQDIKFSVSLLKADLEAFKASAELLKNEYESSILGKKEVK